MTTINNLINVITQVTFTTILLSIWGYTWITVVKRFLDIAKMALHHLFPNVKWFKEEEKKE